MEDVAKAQKLELLNKTILVLLVIFPALLMAVPDGGAAVVVALVLVAITGLWRYRSRKPLDSMEKVFLYVIGAYVAVCLLNLVYFTLPLSEIDNTTRFVALLPLFFFLRKSNIPATAVYYGAIFGAVSCFLIATYQIVVLDLDRAHGVTNAVPFGGLSMTLALMCVAVGLLEEQKRIKILAYSGFLLGMAASVLSGSRGGWLVLFSGFILLLLLNPRNWSLRSRTIVSFLLVGSCVLSYYAIPMVQLRIDQAAQEFFVYFAADLQATSSVGLRLEGWRAASIGYFEHPILGIGEGHFSEWIQHLISEGRIDPFAAILAHAHNEYLSVALHRGTPGLLTLSLIFLMPLAVFYQQFRRASGSWEVLTLCAMILIVSSMTISLSDVYFQHHNKTLFYVFYLYVFMGLRSQNKKPCPVTTSN